MGANSGRGMKIALPWSPHRRTYRDPFSYLKMSGGLACRRSDMFCNHCGTELQPDYKLCPKCGNAIGPARPVATSSPGRLERHLRTLGILWIVVGVLFLIPSIIALAVGSIAHVAITGSEGMARALGPLVLSLIGGSL